MTEYLQETFAPGGHLDNHLPGYLPRPSQIEYAEAVDVAISKGRHLMVEGPTGTGKSMAYSVPAIYHAVTHGKRVVIATANIALQEQLMNKDLPLLADALPYPFKYRMLKGKTNYLCLHQSQKVEQGGQLQLDRNDQEKIDAIFTWASMTPDGDKSDLPFEPGFKLWRHFSVTSEECIGSTHCTFADKCHSLKARASLEDAQVIVVNYSLLFSHIKVREILGRDVILPPFDILIMDEGHEAAEWARGFLGFRISPFSIERISKSVGGNDEADLQSASDLFFGWLARYYRSDKYETRLKGRVALVVWEDLHMQLLHSADQLTAMAAGAEDPIRRETLRNNAKRSAELAQQLEQGMNDRSGDVAYYLEELKGETMALSSKPVHVNEWLRDNLFDNLDSVVVTSATLATGGSFDYVAGELGADHYSELIVDSPFDWEHQAIMVFPKMPEPNSESFAGSMSRRVIESVEQAEGRTLALFTSYRNLNTAYDFLMDEGFPYRIMKQGELPRSQLVEQFREDESSVLLATTSFWGGIDVPGPALSCLVIDKLPFPRPDDPVLDLIQAQDSRSFFNHSVPRAVIAFKQGVGRLLRTVNDYGVVVFLDCRLTTKGYGKTFLASLPKTGRTRRMTAIKGFLDHMAGQQGQPDAEVQA